MSNEIARFNPELMGQIAVMFEVEGGNYVNYEDYLLLLGKYNAVMRDLTSLEMVPKSEHDKLAERIEKLVTLSKSAFKEGFSRGYGNGLDDGHPLSSRKRNDDSESEWEDSESKELLEISTGKEGEKDERIKQLESALRGVLNITEDSMGVAGYHQNGDIAAWSEFSEIEAAEMLLESPEAKMKIKRVKINKPNRYCRYGVNNGKCVHGVLVTQYCECCFNHEPF